MSIAANSDASRLGGSTSRRLYERDTELERLASVVQSASSRMGRFAVILGHAGIGKSALLEAAIEKTGPEDVRGYRARGRESEREFPFGVVLQLFEPHVRSASAAERRRFFAGAAELARPLFEAADWREAFNGERERLPSLLHGLFWLTSNMAERSSPLVLAVDDAHWSDEPSLRYLLYLATRLEALPIALVVAARPEEPGTAQFLLAELCDDSRACVLRPSALSDTAVKALVEDELPFAVEEDFVSACATVTKGNPYLLRELVAGLLVDGIAVETASPDRVLGFVPETVAHRLLMRLGKLPHNAASLANAVAILGDEVPIRYAAALADMTYEDALRAADVLARADIFDTRGLASGYLSFAHPLRREAVYNDRPPNSRAAAHARAAKLLLDEGAPPERIAPHLLRAHRGSEPRAVEVLRAAAFETAARGAPDSAVKFLVRALDETMEDRFRARLLLELAEAELRASQIAEAEHHAREARSLSTERYPRAHAARILGHALFSAGRYKDAGEAFESGLEDLGPHSEIELARELRAAFVAVSTLDSALRERGLQLLEGIVEQSGEDLTSGERGLLAQVAAQRAIAGAPQQEVRALAERAWGDGALLAVETPEGAGWSVVTGALVWCDELERDLDICERALEDARRSGSLLAFATACFCRSWPLLLLGRIEESLADVDAAIAARDDGWERHIGTASWLLAQARLERGDIEGAEKALEVIGDPKLEGSVDYPILLEGRGRVRLLRGEADAALQDFLESGKRLQETFSVRTPVIAPWRAGAALAAHSLGRAEDAWAFAEDNLAIARGIGAPGLIGSALRTQAAVTRGERRLALLHEAVDEFDRVEPRLEQIRALVDLGSALRTAGDRASARQALLGASAIAHRGGATALAERARLELAALGARPRKETLAGTDALTPSEKRVADLAARGLSNRQIAEALFVTIKAVEWHLHHVYQKLDIGSRRELPAALAKSPTAARGTT
jgi:DNA-binding CsgD family transcriptional regulator